MNGGDMMDDKTPSIADLLAIAEQMPKVLPRELHVRNRAQLLGITGAAVTEHTGMGPFAGLPVYCDDKMPNGVMEMRNSETGEVLRRWFLKPDGTLISFNPQAFVASVNFTFTTKWTSQPRGEETT